MNLPVGEVLQQAISVKEINTKDLVISLLEKKFSGYAVITTDGFDGIEDGAIIFRDGLAVAAFYTYDNFGISIYGNTALQHTLNALLSERGVIDIIALSNQQVDLTIAFNDKLRLTVLLDRRQLEKIFPKSFSQDYAKKVLSEVVKEHESRKSVFKRLGLSELGY